MSINNVPSLPYPTQIDGQVSIPPPSADDFNALFGGILPPAQTVTSYWGTTTYYVINPSHPNPSTTCTPRHVVLVHGLGTPAIGLLPLATRLAAASTPTTVLIYDSWGHGLSSTPVTPHVPGLFHLQILHLLAQLQWSRAHFLGFSFGAVVAASFANFHPLLVQSLVLVAPAGLWRKSNLSVWEQFVRWGGSGSGWEDLSAREIYESIGPGPVEEGWEKKFKEKGLYAVPREAIQIWEKENHKGHLASLIGSYRYGGVYDSHHIYESILKSGLATLILLGENDPVFEVEYMQNELKLLAWTGEVQVVSGVGHAVVTDKAEEVNKSMLEFWNGLPEA